MLQILNQSLANQYKSQSQKIRVLSEAWVKDKIFCPNCGNPLNDYPNNQPVADFFCKNCSEDYELKSKKNGVGKKIVDGEYQTMLRRLQSANNPNFFFLNYDSRNYEIFNFVVIPKHFFTPSIIEKRKPLSEKAVRSGWVGCNILLQGIPQSGKIFYIKDGKTLPKSNVLENWNKTLFLRESPKMDLRGWILDTMNCIDRLNKREFTLDEVYAFEEELKKKHPDNNYVKDKIRQQLQFLRDKGYLEFTSRGKYRLT